MEYGTTVDCGSVPARRLAILSTSIFLNTRPLFLQSIEVKSQQNVDTTSEKFRVNWACKSA